MSYEKYYPGGWQSGESGGTPITPEALNHIENGVKELDQGKAPAGFGLGETAARYVDSPDLITNSGFYRSLAPDGVNTARYICVALSERGKSIIGFSETNNGEIFTRNMAAGVWQPWEWVNPPMRPGVEYRTTERWDGKVVYIQMLDFGALPNSTGKNMSVTVSGATKVQCIDFGGFFRNENGSITGALLGLKEFVGHSFSCTTYTFTLGIVTNGDVSAFNAFPVVKYTKD